VKPIVLADGRAVIYRGDCRRIFPFYVKGVDHIICDPPYEEDMHRAKTGTSNSRGVKIYGSQRRIRNDGHASPKPLDFDAIGDLRHWVTTTCIPKGWFIAFCTPEGVAAWRDAIEAAGMRYKRACHFVKPDAAPQFNGQGPAMGAEMFVTAWGGSGYSRWNGGGSRNVFTHPVNPSDRHGLHPTEKPLALMREIIEKFTNPGDLICDPCMGTGATGVAALRLGRRFIGIERQRKYFDAAAARLAEAGKQTDLFLPESKPVQVVFDGMPVRQDRDKMSARNLDEPSAN
jgi:site-specific DNA-methyltransferase (adenine-specific)